MEEKEKEEKERIMPSLVATTSALARTNYGPVQSLTNCRDNVQREIGFGETLFVE